MVAWHHRRIDIFPQYLSGLEKVLSVFEVPAQVSIAGVVERSYKDDDKREIQKEIFFYYRAKPFHHKKQLQYIMIHQSGMRRSFYRS